MLSYKNITYFYKYGEKKAQQAPFSRRSGISSAAFPVNDPLHLAGSALSTILVGPPANPACFYTLLHLIPKKSVPAYSPAYRHNCSHKTVQMFPIKRCKCLQKIVNKIPDKSETFAPLFPPDTRYT